MIIHRILDVSADLAKLYARTKEKAANYQQIQNTRH